MRKNAKIQKLLHVMKEKNKTTQIQIVNKKKCVVTGKDNTLIF